jgi:hypothetical protein
VRREQLSPTTARQRRWTANQGRTCPSGRTRRLERKHAPSADQENKFIETQVRGILQLALSLDQEASEATKGGVTVPFGTFKKVHRCAVISLESRAAQHGHDDFAKAAKELLEKIDQTCPAGSDPAVTPPSPAPGKGAASGKPASTSTTSAGIPPVQRERRAGQLHMLLLHGAHNRAAGPG